MQQCMPWSMLIRNIIPNRCMSHYTQKCDWLEFYRDDEEAIPVNAPKLGGKKVDTCIVVDSDHARDEVSY